MPERVPISALKKFAKGNDLSIVIAIGWDGERTHVITYGDSVSDCDKAAIYGNKVKDYLGWPETLKADPSRVKALRKEIIELKSENALLKIEIEKLRSQKKVVEFAPPDLYILPKKEEPELK